MKRHWALAAIAGLVLAVAGPARAQYAAGDVADGGSITGTVKWAGDAPAPKKIPATKDKEVCGKKEILDEALQVSADKGLKNAVVMLADIKKGKKWASDKATLDQNGCVFVPHVLVAKAGGPVDILNSDGILHNLHTYGTKNPAINKAQPKFKKVMTEKFAKPETFKITCDAHPWMLAWIVVSDHPYVAVTDEQGAFKLDGVPAGAYKVEIFHPGSGAKETKEVKVSAKEEARLAVELKK
jgi:plastocyanin